MNPENSHSPLSNTWPADGLFSRAFRSPLTWLLVISCYVLLTRLWNISGKVMHHDESLFAYYGYWLYMGRGYDYQPILHGPVLQNISALFFLLFDDDQFTMRLPSLVGGLLIFVVGWHFRRYAGVVGMFAILALMALSPSITFYTRFLRNDVPYLTSTLACAYCLLRLFQTGSPRFAWGGVLFAGLMFSMMESSIFFFAACLGFLGTMVLFDLVRPGHAEPTEALPWHIHEVPRHARQPHLDGSTTFSLPSLAGCFLGAVVITAVLGWLFHRVLYATIHIYKPVVGAFAAIGVPVSAQAGNVMVALVTLIVVFALLVISRASLRSIVGHDGLAPWFIRTVWRNKWHLLAALAVVVLFYTTIFTTYFTFTKTASFDHQVRDFKGPVKVLTPVQIYKNTWDYWWDQHKLHRIKGPFHYYLPILLLYELPVVLLVLKGWACAISGSRHRWAHIGALLSMHGLVGLALWIRSGFTPAIDWEYLDKKFHITHPAHFFLVLAIVQVLLYFVPLLWSQRRRVEAFLSYWSVTSLFAYSYAGEKVPWLTVHITGPLIILAGLQVARMWQWRGQWGTAKRYAAALLVVLAVLYQVRNQHYLQFVHPWSPAERLVYNHTSPDVQLALEKIDETAKVTNFGNQLPVYLKGEMGWPLHWYLREYTNITPAAGETETNTTRPLVLVDWDVASAANLQENYVIQRLKVREWWEPPMLDLWAMTDIWRLLTPEETRRTGLNLNQYSSAKNEWRKLWRYLGYREIWIDPENPGWSNGANEFALCVRKDLQIQLQSWQWLNATPKLQDIPLFQPD